MKESSTYGFRAPQQLSAEFFLWKMPPLLHHVYVYPSGNNSSHHVYDIRDFIIRVCFLPPVSALSIHLTESGRTAKHYTQQLCHASTPPSRNPAIVITDADSNPARRSAAARKLREYPKYPWHLRMQVWLNRMKSFKSLL